MFSRFQFKSKAGGRLALLAVVATPFVVVSPASANNAPILVDHDRVQCPTAQYTEIEAAVAAAPPGATIHVCAGTYHVQVVITKSLTIQADTGSILQPVAVTTTTTDAGGVTEAPLLLVKNTSNVSIDDLTVDGAGGAAPTSCALDYVGVMYQNASGSLTHMAVRNIEVPVAPGCQSGEGIYIQSGPHNSVTISDSSVHDYQKTGILVKGTGLFSGTSASLTHNFVTGLGATPNIAQNGVQISDGASATLTNSFINNHLYSSCTSASCSYASTNILVYNPSVVQIQNNTVGTAQIGISVQGNLVQVSNNSVYDNQVYDGIDLIGNANQASGNNIFHSDSTAVYVTGNLNRVSGNTINEAAYGTYAVGAANQVSGNAYYNVVVPGGAYSSAPVYTAVITTTPTPRQAPVSPR